MIDVRLSHSTRAKVFSFGTEIVEKFPRSALPGCYSIILGLEVPSLKSSSPRDGKM